MENRHFKGELEQMQSLSLESKIRMTMARIKGWYEAFEGNVYVSISGGKDSQVLAHIVKGMYPDVPLVFVNTGLEYDSVRKKGIELADEVLKPSMDFVSTIKKYGYPVISKEVANCIGETRSFVQKHGFGHSNVAEQLNEFVASGKINIQDVPVRLCQIMGWAGVNGEKSISLPKEKISLYDKTKYAFLLDAPFLINSTCCTIMKKKPAAKYGKETGRMPIIGTMADESRLRKSKWMKFGCNAFNASHPTSAPLSFWTEQDVLQYIKTNSLEIAEIYGDVCYMDDDGFLYDNNTFNDAMNLITTGMDRTGCVFCLFGITQHTDRLLLLKKEEPKKYDYVMRGGRFDDGGLWIPENGLGYRFVIDWLNEHGNLGIEY